MSDTDALRIVKRWLAKRQLLLGPMSRPSVPITEFATALRALMEPRRRCSPPFATRDDAIAYTRTVAGWIKGSEDADKPLDWRRERALQDRKNGYRLLKKQRSARQERQRLKEKRERSHADALARYTEGRSREWQIIKGSDSSEFDGKIRICVRAPERKVPDLEN
jgi:hypothetical protein